jgi:hypothetical protein
MRRLAFAAVCGTLLLAACSDQSQSPMEPTAPVPDANFGSCRPVRFPIVTVSGLIFQVFPKGKLRTEALLRAAAVTLLWDTCHPAAARKVAVDFVNWIDRNAPSSAPAGKVLELKLAILNGVGIPVGAPPADSPDDFGVGLFDPANKTTNTLIKTKSGRALVQLEPGSFLEPTVITISRKADAFPLHDSEGLPITRQFPPKYDYDAINSSNNHVLAIKNATTGERYTAIVAFCLVGLNEFGIVGSYPEGGYPDHPRIGHNPVTGAGQPAFELLDEVNLADEHLDDDLSPTVCGYTPPSLMIGSFGGGPTGFAKAALWAAGHYLGPLLLPQPLLAATAMATLPPPPPIGGRAPSLSPFGVVDEAGVISNGTVSLGVNPTGNLIVGTPSTGVPGAPSTGVGLRYVPTDAEALAIAVPTEGWGVAAGAVAGYANRAQGAPFNMTVHSFIRTATTAKSVVDIGSTFRVTHEYQPTTTPNLYKVDVAIKNLSATSLDVVYRRVMDWDIEPTPFNEFVSVRGTTGITGVPVSATNNGPYASADPRVALPGAATGDFSTGPTDQGATFDLSFTGLESGATKTFVLYYGAAANTSAAQAAALLVGVEVLTLARPNVGGPVFDGSPNTFIAAFKGLGRPVLTPLEIGGMLRLAAPSSQLTLPSRQQQQYLKQLRR